MYKNIKYWLSELGVIVASCGAIVGLFVVMLLVFPQDSWISILIGFFCTVSIMLCACLPSEVWNGICETRIANDHLKYSSYRYRMLIAELARLDFEYECR